MRDSTVIIISATLLLVAALFRTNDSFVEPNLGTILQLFATLSNIAAVGCWLSGRFRSFDSGGPRRGRDTIDFR